MVARQLLDLAGQRSRSNQWIAIDRGRQCQSAWIGEALRLWSTLKFESSIAHIDQRHTSHWWVASARSYVIYIKGLRHWAISDCDRIASLYCIGRSHRRRQIDANSVHWAIATSDAIWTINRADRSMAHVTSLDCYWRKPKGALEPCDTIRPEPDGLREWNCLNIWSLEEGLFHVFPVFFKYF